MKRLIVSLLHLFVCMVIHVLPFDVWKRLLVLDFPCKLQRSLTVSPPLLAKKIMLLIRRSYVGSPTCLESSLVLHIILACYGVKAICCLGVQIENGRLIGHAWVESAGEVLGDEFPLGTYVQLFPIVKK